MTKIVKYPFGKADVQSVGYASTVTLEVANQETLVTLGKLTGAATLKVEVDSEVKNNAELTMLVEADGTTRTLTPDSGFVGGALTVTASKKFAIHAKFLNGEFVVLSFYQLN